METRKERYSKYREQIRHMREEDFPKGKRTSHSENASGSQDNAAVVSQQPSSMLPYDLYLNHRHKMVALKIIAFAIAVAAFVVWWILMQGR